MPRVLHLSAAGLLAIAMLSVPAAALAQRHLPRPAYQPEARRRLLAATANSGACAFRDIDVNRYGMQTLKNPPEIRARLGAILDSLVVEYTDPAFTSIAGCPVKLRTYNGRLVGPTLRVKPGELLAPFLINRLPRESPAAVDSQFQQENGNAFLTMQPYSFNTTNLHTHGLHVSPEGNGDNVLLAIRPQTSLHYYIPLPSNHTRGTYWYHAHTHGSTAVQVGSGMAGALIVEDDSTRIPLALKAANRGEKVMVIQTILYDTAGQANNIASFFPDSPATDSLCREGNSGCTWENSRRRMTINGQIVPVIRMRPGEVQRWRLIDTSFRENLGLRLERHALNEIALDGIYTGRIDVWGANQDLILGPGNRSDVLVQASTTTGQYALVDDSSSAARSLRGVAERADTIAILEVTGTPMSMTLPTQQEMAALNPFPGVDLTSRADQVQETVFKLGAGMSPGDPRNSFQVNYAAFDDSRIHYVQLNNVDMWSITTVGDPAAVPPQNAVPPLPHVFHIHVNPFQVYRTGPQGQRELVWKDTQLIPAGDTVNIFTQYLDFTGKFVLHCHILDHEDLGMMEVVDVVRELPVPHPVETQSSMPHGTH
jgi:FtsP/CotA-like multicopper oxidase with cupredoxin domain